MNVIEIFDSIDGEGIYTGCLATFIRLAGCNLRCRYCDTKYSFTGGTKMSIDEIIEQVDAIGNKHITLTGGEPLIHREVEKLINRLCEKGYTVNIETNGSVNIVPYQFENTVITMDYKTISSGENGHMCDNYIKLLRTKDVLKIVCNEDDFEDIEQMLKRVKPRAQIFISPIFNEIKPEMLVNFSKLLRDKGICDNVRVQIQLHKIIWKPDARGV